MSRSSSTSWTAAVYLAASVAAALGLGVRARRWLALRRRGCSRSPARPPRRSPSSSSTACVPHAGAHRAAARGLARRLALVLSFLGARCAVRARRGLAVARRAGRVPRPVFVGLRARRRRARARRRLRALVAPARAPRERGLRAARRGRRGGRSSTWSQHRSLKRKHRVGAALGAAVARGARPRERARGLASASCCSRSAS